MSTRPDDLGDSPLIAGRADLIEAFAEGCKPRSEWTIGTEHEKFVFSTRNLRAIPYGGDAGIRRILEEMIARYGWRPVHENGVIVALKAPAGKNWGGISLEPGGQLELSGATLKTVHETCSEVNAHLGQVRAIGKDLGIGFLGLGFQPKWCLTETPMMPKARYNIMRNYMPKVGGRGLDMMYRSCTIQVNLDFASEADMVRKLRVGLALQPIATALFANSPFEHAKPVGFQSLRSEIWRDTDGDRTGMLPIAFEDGFGFERYVDYALTVPMYFIVRSGEYIDCAGMSFLDFLDGRLPALPGEQPTIADWKDHISTIFPEVRAKSFLEMRGADGGPWDRVCALPALWVGLLYDETGLGQAEALIAEWSASERQALRDGVPRDGLRAQIGQRTVREVARDVLAIAKGGLKSRASSDGLGSDETQYLVALERIVETGQTQSDRLLEKFHGEWAGEIEPIFRDAQF
ncbi:MAG: glutamate--cysteine ligase [Pseudomonadota bacterium]